LEQGRVELGISWHLSLMQQEGNLNGRGELIFGRGKMRVLTKKEGSITCDTKTMRALGKAKNQDIFY